VPIGRLEELQDKVGVAFRDSALLREALTHSSFANESPHVSPRDNERLEYLGDAVLQLITAEYLFKLRPGAKEGEMTQLRSAMVNTNTLAALAEELGLGDYLFLGKGIAKGGGRTLRSLLANAFESVLGAIFLDAGYDASYHYYLDRFRALPEPVGDERTADEISLTELAPERPRKLAHGAVFDQDGVREACQRQTRNAAEKAVARNHRGVEAVELLFREMLEVVGHRARFAGRLASPRQWIAHRVPCVQHIHQAPHHTRQRPALLASVGAKPAQRARADTAKSR